MATLYVVATPIGNLQDMSPRAVETLRNCQLIAAEDTRVTIKLLNYFQIKTPQTSYHQHNEKGKSHWIVEKMLEENMDVALVTDAGTPAISDPGVVLVEQAIERGIQVVPIPGASAAVAALSVSGFDLQEFAFYGFLPREKKAQQEKLLEMEEKGCVSVVYESPHRIKDLLKNADTLALSAKVALFSDLTKHYERAYRGTPLEVLNELQANEKANKGEYVVVFSFAPKIKNQTQAPEKTFSLESQIFDFLYNGYTSKEAIALLIKDGVKKNEAYKASLNVKKFMEQ